MRRSHPRHRGRLSVRLFWQVYLALAGSLMLSFLLAGMVFWLFRPDEAPPRRWEDSITALISAALPPADAPPDAQRAAFERLAAQSALSMILYDRTGRRLAGARDEPRRPPRAALPLPWRHRPFERTLRLADGRAVALQPPFRRPDHFPWLPLGWLAALGVAVALAAWPLSRRLTRRLERLANRLDALGEGDLSARVEVHGHDEVGRLAERFNRAAERIEALVGAHKSLLAHASHELRSPLARLRMAAELLGEGASPALREELVRNVRELDELVDEILLMSRLDTQAPAADAQVRVDVRRLCEEEADRTGAHVSGPALAVRGDPRLLRRLVRNLLENAQRHGVPPVALRIAQAGTQIELRVCDAGPGIEPAHRDRLFEPFFRPPGASESAGGYGLGLALVRNIARRHGGDVRYEVPDAGGSCFVVTLPERR